MNPLWALVPPLAVIPFILLLGEKRKNWREVSILVAGVALFLINKSIYNDLMAGGTPQSGEIGLLADYTLKLSAEPMGVMFGLLASFLWVVTTVYSIGYMRGHHEINQTRFYTCFAIALAAVMGAAYADNLLTLFVAYEVITISTFPLVTHAGGVDAKKAGRVYLGILMTTSIGFLLPAIVWTATVGSSLDFVPGGVLADSGLSNGAMACLLGLFVFGITARGSRCKNRCFQFTEDCHLHVWNRHRCRVRSRAMVSACCSFYGHCVVYRGVYISGGVLHIVMHAFGKITLFFCAGAILVALHKSEISKLDGIGRRMPITMGAFFIGAVSIIGLPPAGGVWSKLLIAGGSLDTGTIIWASVLMLSTLLNIAYLLPIPLRAFFKPDPSLAPGEKATLQEAPPACLWAIVLTAFTCLLLFVYPQPLTELIGLIQWR